MKAVAVTLLFLLVSLVSLAVAPGTASADMMPTCIHGGLEARVGGAAAVASATRVDSGPIIWAEACV
jgi:hypothetical protein